MPSPVGWQPEVPCVECGRRVPGSMSCPSSPNTATWPRCLRALPPGIPVAVESPTLELAKTVDALERARRAIAGVRRVLEAAGLDRADARAGQETM